MNKPNNSRPKKRETIAWILALLQFLALTSILSSSSSPDSKWVKSSSSSSIGGDQPTKITDATTSTTSPQDFLINQLKMNNHPNTYYEQRRMEAMATTSIDMDTSSSTVDRAKPSYYEKPVIHHKDAGLVGRIWHSNGSPSINPELHQGSCWCSFDEWCVCTPALAIDLIIESGSDHIWVIRRQDTGLLALMGGFTEIGETSLETVGRELMEEMNIELPKDDSPRLFGVYNDPLRDVRRHTTSVVFVVSIPEDIKPKAGDDATGVLRLHLSEVEKNDFFIDHKTVLKDYMKMKQRERGITAGQTDDIPPIPRNGDGEPFKRAICPMS